MQPNPKKNLPITRKELADQLGICTKTLARFIKNEGLQIKSRNLLNPATVKLILEKYLGGT